MRPAIRLTLRRVRRQALRQGDHERAALCAHALHDPDLLDLVAEAQEARFAEEAQLITGGDLLPKLLEWLWEHREEILKLILALLSVMAQQEEVD